MTNNGTITRLTGNDFCGFISDKDIVMVMFYDPNSEACSLVTDEFIQAPKITHRPDTAYGVVNCDIEGDLCFREKVFEVPQFRAYSHGRLLDKFEDTFSMTAARLARFVMDIPLPVGSSTPVPPRRRR